MTSLTIHGYTLHTINNEPMIEDMVLANKLGYEKPHNIRKLIERSVENGSIDKGQLFSTVEKTTGRPGTKYYLSQKAALKIVTKSETEMADQITDEMIDVFVEYRQGLLPASGPVVPIGPLELKANESKALLQCFMDSSELLGMDKPMARVVAVDEVRELGGLDFGRFLAHNTVEEAPVSPTELGKEIKARTGIKYSAQKVNKLLLSEGMQEWIDGSWVLTDKGREYATVMPFKGKGSSHSGYHIRWYKRVLDAITPSE